MTAEALAIAAEHLANNRRSIVRLVALSTAKAIARGRVPHLATDIEAALLHDLRVYPWDDGVEIAWRAHCGQPGRDLERLPWCPGTPLPDHAQFATCTASAPLQD
jgi:hypothetical protein